MKTNFEVINRWKLGNLKETHSSEFEIESGVLKYTGYGLREGRTAAVRTACGKVLVNGDRYFRRGWGTSPQTELLQVLEGSIQIPFSALRAAGINPEHIQIIDSVPDTWSYWCPECGREAYYPEPSSHYKYLHKDDDTHLCASGKTVGEYYTVDEDNTCTNCDKPTAHNSHIHLDGTERCLMIVPIPHTATSTHELGGVVFRVEKRYFISSIDANEPKTRNYFLSELPRACKTFSQAIESLRPSTVPANSPRQGEWFFVQIPDPTEGALSGTKTIGGRHRADKSWTHRGKVIAFGGTIRHTPRLFRNKEHQNLKLHKGWFKAVKNRAKGSWSAEGNVD